MHDKMRVIPKSTKNNMSLPFEDPIRIGWVNGLMNWSTPLKKYNDPPNIIKSIPKGIYLFIFRFIINPQNVIFFLRFAYFVFLILILLY